MIFDQLIKKYFEADIRILENRNVKLIDQINKCSKRGKL